MKQQSGFTDEILNAYIDGELSTEDELLLLDAMQHNTALVNRVNELKRLKLLVTTTYKTGNSKPKPALHKNTARLSLVASVLLMVGVVGGWVSHDILLNTDSNTIALTGERQSNEIPPSKIQAVKTTDTWNVVLHVNSNDEYVQKTILDETESLLESFRDSKQNVQVEIVAYGKGVFLFDNEKSKYKERLSGLKNNFSNLSYAVCGRTVKRIEKAEGRKIHLISSMTVARSGLHQIIKRQKQGWNYIRI